jgi:hypothetical protein
MLSHIDVRKEVPERHSGLSPSEKELIYKKLYSYISSPYHKENTNTSSLKDSFVNAV